MVRQARPTEWVAGFGSMNTKSKTFLTPI